jgi:hypothetical protein
LGHDLHYFGDGAVLLDMIFIAIHLGRGKGRLRRS